MTAHPIVEAKGLTKFYGAEPLRRKALHAVDLTVNRGEFVTVRGPSGCGKSTLLGIVGGLDRQFDGKLWLFGDDVELLSDAELAHRRARRLGFVFQAFHLLGHLNARENVLTASLFSEEHASASARRRLTERADDLLGQLGLEGRGDDMPATMSGGERQRVAIARALLFEPELLLCDEPTGNLDAVTGQQIIDVFARLHREQGVTVIAVTHEQRVVDAATRAIEMHGGQLDGVSDLASSSTPGGKEA